MSMEPIAFDQSLTDLNLGSQVFFTAPERGVYQVNVALICLFPATQLQLTVNYYDPAIILADTGLPLTTGVTDHTNSYTLSLTAAAATTFAIDQRILVLESRKNLTISGAILVKSGSITYRVKAMAMQLGGLP